MSSFQPTEMLKMCFEWSIDLSVYPSIYLPTYPAAIYRPVGLGAPSLCGHCSVETLLDPPAAGWFRFSLPPSICLLLRTVRTRIQSCSTRTWSGSPDQFLKVLVAKESAVDLHGVWHAVWLGLKRREAPLGNIDNHTCVHWLYFLTVFNSTRASEFYK